MFLSYIFKYIKRGFVTNALFCLLLTLSAILLCLSVGLWYSTDKAMRDLDKTINTIAIPDNDFVIKNYAKNAGGGLTEDDVKASIRENVYNSGLFEMDSRRFFGGYSNGVIPITLKITPMGLRVITEGESPKNFAAYELSCVRVNHYYSIGNITQTEGMDEPQLIKYIKATFMVDDIMHLDESLKAPDIIQISLYIMNPDGTAPVEVGGKYLALGIYSVVRGNEFFLFWGEAITSEKLGSINDYSEINRDDFEYWSFYRQRIENEVSYPIDIWQYVVEEGNRGYTLFSLDEVVDIDEYYHDYAVRISAFPVLTTNNPNSILRLNQRRDFLTEGRSFTPDEVANGARVCLVSSHFAELNGLKTGDTLPIKMFASVLGSEEIIINAGDGRDSIRTIWRQSGYSSDTPLSEPIEYKIVGLYEVLKLGMGDHALSPNTVIIPDTSFAGIEGNPASQYYVPDYAPPLLSDAMIVPNGKIGETKVMLDSIADGYSSLFTFYDQGYALLMNTLSNMRYGMSWVLGLALLGWMTMNAIFSFFYISRKRNEAELLSAIGVGDSKRFLWVFAQCSIIIIVAQAVSIVMALIFYGDILDIVSKSALSFTLDFREMILSDAVEVGVRRELSIEKSPISIILTTLAGTGILLTVAGFVTARTVKFAALNDRRGEE